MPVEIKELLIEINVTPENQNDSGMKDLVAEQIRIMADYAEGIMLTINDKNER